MIGEPSIGLERSPTKAGRSSAGLVPALSPLVAIYLVLKIR